MKDNPLDGHRGKVAALGKHDSGTPATNFDDDYNEWELGIGDLIIDLDADIEKNNEKGAPQQQQQQQNGSSSFGGSVNVGSVSSSTNSGVPLGTVSGTSPGGGGMSNSKSSRMSGGGSSTSNGGTSAVGATVEHQATVDKGLKMKIKRKNVGGKASEAKHEIVQSDTKATNSPLPVLDSVSAVSNGISQSSSTSILGPGPESKSKHSSSKGRSSSHREKKEKNREKDKEKVSNKTLEVNGVIGNASIVSPSLKITNSNIALASLPTATVSLGVPTTVGLSPSTPVVSSSANTLHDHTHSAMVTTGSCASSMPSLTVKLEAKYPSIPLNNSVILKPEDLPKSPPAKRLRCDKVDRTDAICSPIPPEMRDNGTCTSVGTITEPECLGPCEPGTSVTLEGIVWHETEGGVLVVNVTWRGKTYVGTLLDCTKHDWAPPRFCESPTSDIDAKNSKGRGKRGRNTASNSNEANTFVDSRTTVQSKLRNGKGRRTTANSNSYNNAGFTVPVSPAKSDSNSSSSNGKRKSRPADLELSPAQTEGKGSKRSRSQSRSTPTPSSSASVEFPQPSSPVLIECPEPNCSKKYKHINGLRYHQTHAHNSSEVSKLEDIAMEDSKDVPNSSDNDESVQEGVSAPLVPDAPFATSTLPVTPGPRTPQSNDASGAASSSSSSTPDEGENFALAADLTTLASIAIGDSKDCLKNTSHATHNSPPVAHPPVSAVLDPSSMPPPGDASKSSPAMMPPPTPPPLPLPPLAPPPSNFASPPPVTSTTVIQPSSVPRPLSPLSSSACANQQPASAGPATTTASLPSAPSVTVSIPTSHVFSFSQTPVPSNVAPLGSPTTTGTQNANAAPSVRHVSPASSGPNFPPPPLTTVGPSAAAVVSTDKCKLKQDKPLDKYKPKSPGSSSSIRTIVNAPAPQVITLATNIPTSHSSMNSSSHGLSPSSLKPIQPKPTILGEPTTVNPALESLRKEKSKHKKKSKDKDRERKGQPSPERKHPDLPPSTDSDRLGSHPFMGVETISGTKDAISSLPPTNVAQHRHSTSPVAQSSHPLDSPLEVNTDTSSNINENVQSPAYSDISDANDTAPVLESEMPSGKDKDGKTAKPPADAGVQSSATNLGTFMYSYYNQPPYLIPSVPQNTVPPSSTSTGEKSEQGKKLDSERSKEHKSWNPQGGEANRERPLVEPEAEKKLGKEESIVASTITSNSTTPGTGLQEYPLQQPYPYPYGFMQSYPYGVDPTYHMHLLASDPHYKQQYERYVEEQERIFKEQAERQQGQQQAQSQSVPPKDNRPPDSKDRVEKNIPPPSMPNTSGPLDLGKQSATTNSIILGKERESRERESRPPSLPLQSRAETAGVVSIASTTAANLKEKQNENHQILKENIELKSQMDASKAKYRHYEAAMLYGRHREYYYLSETLMEQQKHEKDQQPTQQTSTQPAMPVAHSRSREEPLAALAVVNKMGSLGGGEATRSATVISPPKPDFSKAQTSVPSSGSSSSPKRSVKEPLVQSKEHTSGSSSSASLSSSSSNKKESGSISVAKTSDTSEASTRDDKARIDKNKPQSEGQKPTMETTGPPPPPTTSYAYLHPSYLQPPPPHFAHMPFDPTHPVYRSGLSPMLMSAPPHYGSSPYLHPQLRYHVPPGPCDLTPHSQPSTDPLGPKLHPSGPPKALDLLHQVSQHYTTHKIHELQERALMSPTPASAGPGGSLGSSTSAVSKVSSADPALPPSKQEPSGSTDRSRSPPPQRHLHTHHHTHVGVGYPLYDPYGVAQQPWKQAQNQRRVPYRLMR